MKTRRAFTLIELLVVISIIALLLAILLPGLRLVKEHAKLVVCSTRLNQIGKATILYSDMSNGLLPDDHLVDTATNKILTDKRWLHAYAVYRRDPSNNNGYEYSNGKLKPFRFAYYYELDLITKPEIFYCPGNKNTLFKYESYSSPEPWSYLPQDWNEKDENGKKHNQWVRVGYTYYPTEEHPELNSEYAPKTPPTKFVKLNQNIPYTTDVIHGLDNLSHQYGGKYKVDALFKDGSVTTCSDQDVFNDDRYTSPVKPWENFENDGNYDTTYYWVFKRIGL